MFLLLRHKPLPNCSLSIMVLRLIIIKLMVFLSERGYKALPGDTCHLVVNTITSSLYTIHKKQYWTQNERYKGTWQRRTIPKDKKNDTNNAEKQSSTLTQITDHDKDDKGNKNKLYGATGREYWWPERVNNGACWTLLADTVATPGLPDNRHTKSRREEGRAGVAVRSNESGMMCEEASMPDRG